ncbi:winged helix-turn-helix domain-containing protein [Saccharomonospora sp. NPDC046836]|uniref:winged helix-turn-helix domain-containing protein n=1 Tax=Saccharomonospora sp. NPDC046836 TaxID=3156921 RepID=UPI0033F0B357
MRALARPLRSALLGYLLSVGPRTASECAVAVDSSASNCSWHLRQLARWGLVERVEAGDAREKPWQATQVGLEMGELGTEHAGRAARRAGRCRRQRPGADAAVRRPGRRAGPGLAARLGAEQLLVADHPGGAGRASQHWRRCSNPPATHWCRCSWAAIGSPPRTA